MAKKKTTKRKTAKKKTTKKARKKSVKKAVKKIVKRISRLGKKRKFREIKVGGTDEYMWSTDIRTGYYDGREITYSAIDGLAIFEGDIVLGTVDEMEAFKRAVESPPLPGTAFGLRAIERGLLWPGGIVPYYVEPEMANQGRINIARDLISASTNVQFIERTTERNWIFFRRTRKGCSYSLGMQRGMQEIKLSSSCHSIKIAHEIFHALGVMHEHNRFDRKNNVIINWDNIRPEAKGNFRAAVPGLDFGNYDYDSIMHYKKRAYAIDTSVDTITPTPDETKTIGQRIRLSTDDIATLNAMYPDAVPLGETSTDGPALTQNNNRILLAFTGFDDGVILTRTSTNGAEFSPATILGERSPSAPALASKGDYYYLAWRGDGNNKLNVMKSINGITWTDKVTLNETTPSEPSITNIGGELFLAWRGAGGNDRLNIIRSFDGRNWSPKVTLNERTTSGPALSSIGANLLIVWRGVGNNQINVMPRPFGALPLPKVTLNETTDSRPGICTIGNRAFLIWQGPGNRFINVMASSDGANWSNKSTFDSQLSVDSPAIISFGSILMRAWTDAASPSPNEINTRMFPVL